LGKTLEFLAMTSYSSTLRSNTNNLSVARDIAQHNDGTVIVHQYEHHCMA